MRMIPSQPHDTRSRAELRVFRQLSSTFSEPTDEGWIAFHSLNLPAHPLKRQSEIDFVVCSVLGIMVLEVKGGRVACRDGEWTYIDRFDRAHVRAEGPFRQASSAMFALRQRLDKHLPKSVVDQFSMGYGVILPDCELHEIGAEWDSRTLLDIRNWSQFSGWLKNLFRYWRDKDRHLRIADRNALHQLVGYLRPDFEAVRPLHVEAAYIDDEVVRLTEDQLRWVDVVTANPRVLCSGGAGTGKTFLAMELCRRWSGEGGRFALVCRSPWLRQWLEARFSVPGLSVCLVESLHVAARRAGIERFDGIVVDEGQDIFDMNSLDIIDRFLVGGLSSGRWCIFHDYDNQANLVGEADKFSMDYLHSLHAARVPLKTNCRNTRQILELVKKQLGADMGIAGPVEGPKVRIKEARNISEAVGFLEMEIRNLIKDQGIAYGDITILSPLPLHRSSAEPVCESVRRHIVEVDEFSLRAFPFADISFAEIAKFKGLENRVILLIDLPTPQGNDRNNVLHYVGMSRARAILSIIYSDTPMARTT